MEINVILGGTTVYENGVPVTKGGTLSKMDTADLRQKTIHIDNDVETTDVIEYWLGEELVHRSVDMHLKTGIFAIPEQAEIGG